MSETQELFAAVAVVVEDNTDDNGVDFVNIFYTLIEAMKQNPTTTIEDWKTLRLSMNNAAAVVSNLIDEVIQELHAEDKNE